MTVGPFCIKHDSKPEEQFERGRPLHPRQLAAELVSKAASTANIDRESASARNC